MRIRHDSQRKFAHDMQALGRSPSTTSKYQSPLNHWFEYVAKKTGKPIGDIDMRKLRPVRTRPGGPVVADLPVNAEFVEGFLTDFCRDVVDHLARGRKRNRALQVMRLFMRHQVITGKLVHDPTRLIRASPVPRRVSARGHLTRQEFRSLLAASINSGSDSELHAALVCTMGWSGIRPIEARNLTPGDLDLSRGLMVVSGKGEPRSAPVLAELGETLRRYMTTQYFQDKSNGRPDSPLFRSPRTSNPLTADELREIIRKLGEAAGIPKRVTPYMLRHTFATLAYEDSVPFAVIARALGHKRLQNTYFYIHSLRKRLRVVANQNDASGPLEKALQSLKQQGYYMQLRLALHSVPTLYQ